MEKIRKHKDGVEESLLLPLLLGHDDDLPALICDEDKTDSLLSYKWLRQASLLLAHRLLEKSYRHQEVIGVCFGATTVGAVVAMVAAQ
jgi:hypothetical protein